MAVLYFTIAVSGAVFEGFGMAMFLPVLQFIENGQDVAALSQKEKIFNWLVKVFDFVHLPVTLLTLLASVFLLMMLRILTMYLRQVYSVWLTQEIQHSTRNNLFKKYMEAEYAFFDKVSTGSVINLITTETVRVGSSFGSLFAIFSNLVVVLFYVILLFLVSREMTLFAVCILGGASALVYFLVRHTKKISHQTTKANEKLSFLLVERLSSFRIIKLSATAAAEIDRIKTVSARVKDHIFEMNKLNARIDLFLEPIVVLCGISLLYASVNIFSMSLAQTGVFLLILLRLLPIFKELLRSRQTYMACSGSLGAICEGFERADKVVEGLGGTLSLDQLRNGIRFENVSFRYPDHEEMVLSGLNVFFPQGKITA
ncbi:MAG: ABC transporter, transmembrane region, partial [uncultured bacterium]